MRVQVFISLALVYCEIREESLYSNKAPVKYPVRVEGFTDALL